MSGEHAPFREILFCCKGKVKLDFQTKDAKRRNLSIIEYKIEVHYEATVMMTVVFSGYLSDLNIVYGEIRENQVEK